MGQPHDRDHPNGPHLPRSDGALWHGPSHPQTHYEPFLQPNGNYNPDTYQYCAGYQYEDSAILGFAHTSFSGTGHSDLGDLLMMPTVGRPDLSSDERGGPQFGSPFQHNRETAEAGYYAVDLDRYAVRAELTSTQRVGVHRYTYEEGGEAYIALDLAYNIYHHPDKNLWHSCVSKTTLRW